MSTIDPKGLIFGNEDMGFPVEAMISTNGKTEAFKEARLAMLAVALPDGKVDALVVGFAPREQIVDVAAVVIGLIAGNGLLEEAIYLASIQEEGREHQPVTGAMGRLIVVALNRFGPDNPKKEDPDGTD